MTLFGETYSRYDIIETHEHLETRHAVGTHQHCAEYTRAVLDTPAGVVDTPACVLDTSAGVLDTLSCPHMTLVGGQTYSMYDIIDAHEHLETHHAVGKCIIQVISSDFFSITLKPRVERYQCL